MNFKTIFDRFLGRKTRLCAQNLCSERTESAALSLQKQTKHSQAQLSTAKHSQAKPSTARHSQAQPSTAKHSQAQPSTPSTDLHSPVQPCTAPCSPARPSLSFRSLLGRLLRSHGPRFLFALFSAACFACRVFVIFSLSCRPPASLARPSLSFRSLFGRLGPSWVTFCRSWASLGRSWVLLGAFWVPFGRS